MTQLKDSMSNIEKIRKEIERRKDELERDKYINIDAKTCRQSELKYLERFIDSLPDEICKDSLQVQESCKENTDSFTSLKSKVIGYRTTPNELGEIESADVIILAANNVIYTDYITLYPVWTIAHKQEEVIKEVEEFKKRKLKK